MPEPTSHRYIVAALCVCALAAGTTVLIAHDGGKGHEKIEPYKGTGFKGDNDTHPPLNFPSEHVILRSWLPLHELHSNAVSGNDCVGYVSPSGREYAIMGVSSGTAFVEVTNPGDAQVVAFVSGPESLWRDMKVYQHYLYAGSEGGGHVQIMDMSEIDEGIVTLIGNTGGPGTNRTHNVHINEESGYLYRCGGGSGTIGIRAYSLADPENPVFVGSWHDRYVHDAQVVNWTEGTYAGREIAFLYANNASNGGNPALDILDVTDKQNMTLIARVTYTWPRFSHQGWLSPCREYVYLGDELNEKHYSLPTTTNIIKLNDLHNAVEVGTYTNNNTAITHNIYTRDNLLFQANYRSGLRIADISDRENPVEVAYFDTYPQNNNPQFNSLWSNYPYLPSGIVLGSDMEKGLFVWQLDLPPDCEPADLNCDGVVDGADLGILLANWGDCDDPPECDDCIGDLNDDCVVDGADLGILLANWG